MEHIWCWRHCLHYHYLHVTVVWSCNVALLVEVWDISLLFDKCRVCLVTRLDPSWTRKGPITEEWEVLRGCICITVRWPEGFGCFVHTSKSELYLGLRHSGAALHSLRRTDYHLWHLPLWTCISNFQSYRVDCGELQHDGTKSRLFWAEPHGPKARQSDTRWQALFLAQARQDGPGVRKETNKCTSQNLELFKERQQKSFPHYNTSLEFKARVKDEFAN